MKADADYSLSVSSSFLWAARTPDVIFAKKRRGSNLTVTRTHKHSAISSVTVCTIMLTLTVMVLAGILISTVWA